MDELCRPALYVPDHGSDIDCSQPPTSAREYLQRVRLEVQSCPGTVVADVDRNVFKGRQTVTVSESTGFCPAPTGYAPTIECQRNQAASFSELRQLLSHHRSKATSRYYSKPTLPKLHEEGAWCVFCFGEDFWKRLKQKRSGNVTQMDVALKKDEAAAVATAAVAEAAAAEAAAAAACSESRVSGVPPLLSIVIALEQPTVYQLLEYHIDWLNYLGFSIAQGCWFFAFLACLEKPLLPDAASMLRTLARQCSALRASLETLDDQCLAPLNLLICLVARYFDQSDLADNG